MSANRNINATLDNWIRHEAISFYSGSSETFDGSIDRVIASLAEYVELLGFGEALHGGEDILKLRNGLFRRLAESHGYSAIAIESSFPRARVVDDYVAGSSPASFEAVLEDGFSHGFGQLEANRELVEWMRCYNADPAKSIGLSPAANALRIETEDLIVELRRRRPELVAKSDPDRYLQAVQYAALARELLNFHAASARKSDDLYARLLGIRDASMADNLAYIVKRERQRGKVLAFSHNSHLQRGKAVLPWPGTVHSYSQRPGASCLIDRLASNPLRQHEESDLHNPQAPELQRLRLAGRFRQHWIQSGWASAGAAGGHGAGVEMGWIPEWFERNQLDEHRDFIRPFL